MKITKTLEFNLTLDDTELDLILKALDYFVQSDDAEISDYGKEDAESLRKQIWLAS